MFKSLPRASILVAASRLCDRRTSVRPSLSGPGPLPPPDGSGRYSGRRAAEFPTPGAVGRGAEWGVSDTYLLVTE